MRAVQQLFAIKAPLVLALGALAGFLVSAYISSAASHAETSAAPPPSVEVMPIKAQSLRTWVDYSGRLSAVDSAIVKPQVSGTIEKILFSEGQWVKKGQPLFVIDPRPQQVALQRAQAQFASANAQATLAQDELKRAQTLYGDKLVSKSLYESALSAAHVAAANMQQAQAAVNQAQLNLEYAHINAPISGRISRAELTEGNLVEAGANAPVLTQIVANDKLYAEFNVDEATYINLVRTTAEVQHMPVELTLASAKAVTYPGHIASFDNKLDVASGTIRARAIFDNQDGALTAGMFASIRLGSAGESAVLLVPERAIGTNQSKKFVMVVDDKNTASYREITLGDHYQGQRVVLSGLQTGDKIIVNGLSHVRPNTQVTPKIVEPKAPPQVAAIGGAQ